MKSTATPTTPPDDFLSPLAPANESTPDWFPDLGTLSAGFFYRLLPIPLAKPAPPEYVYVPRPPRTGRRWTEFDLTVANWNSVWESGPFAPATVERRYLPRQLRWLTKVEDRTLRLIPRHPWHRYNAYAALYHLIPATVLGAARLPLLRRGLWPYANTRHGLDDALPRDFDVRLGHAFSSHIWPLLNNRSCRGAFSRSEPVRLLSHHLDFWLPYIDLVAQRRALSIGPPTVKQDRALQRDIDEFNQLHADMRVEARRPVRGGHLWIGADEAWEATQELVDVADEHGRLREIIDAVKSHRAQDDFSPLWSYEREDFERKMYRRRAKTKVVFVEMPETAPVYSEDTEVHERLLWGDFMALLDAKERRVVVCLRRGAVGAVDIAKELGYANHSPVSKALARIRRKARAFLES